MKVTVLPLRGPQHVERTPRVRPEVSGGVASRGGGLEGISPSTVEIRSAERKRLADRSPRGTGAPKEAPPAKPEAAVKPSESPALLEILLTNGRVVRVPPGFSQAELEQVLALAERAP